MKKIGLLGDSIRKGYGKKVQEALGDGYEVLQGEENGQTCFKTLRDVLYDYKDWLKECDVIHWNNGLWNINDLGDGPFTEVEDYCKCMVRIARILKSYTPNVIFATTTPTRPPYFWMLCNENIEKYNKAICEVLVKEGIVINDLYTPLYNNMEQYISPEDLHHLTEEGEVFCAELVAQSVKNILKK
ncbi:MAG: SGNH/GDSL hydrolase family protein [Clostridia bacterium]|nr:SGNH/GDSL hydrolase family protein [Clostridia bacterium]